MAGAIILCDSSCKTCSGRTAKNCTSCYMGSLNGGVCTACNDNNALDCLPSGPAFASHCASGYTSAFYTSSIMIVVMGGRCMACINNCHKCDITGPRNCDLNECYMGFVQIRGTTNCTQCPGGCPSCSTDDPNVCLFCPSGQHTTIAGGCMPCAINCKACTDNSTCTKCNNGYQVIGTACVVIPANCVALETNLSCAACYKGFSLGSNGFCLLDTACNSTNTCLTCAVEAFLSAGKCQACGTLPTNCLTCNRGNSSQCIRCKDGFYVSEGNICKACSFGCTRCVSSDYCTRSRDGYLLVRLADMTESGQVKICKFPCITCMNDPRYCTKCFTGYLLNGTKCVEVSQVQLKLTLIGSGAVPIDTAGADSQDLFNSIASINRLQQTLCSKLPSVYYGILTTGEKCIDTVIVTSLASPDIILSTIISGGGYSTAAQATTSINEVFAVSTVLDGVTVSAIESFATNYTDKCLKADLIECLSSICPSFYYLNGACLLNATLTGVCSIPGNVFSGGACVDCSTLPASTCTAICPDYFFSSGACTPCQTLYSDKCVKCNSTSCLVCAESSILMLASNQKSCVNKICALTSCRACYQGGTKCFLCQQGFVQNANFECI